MIGGKIKELREEKKLSQEAFAKAIRISRSALAHYELGNCDVPNDLIPIIAKFFDVTTDYLFDIEK
jgi:transcriptional regulator with XRE-family HTH domain